MLGVSTNPSLPSKKVLGYKGSSAWAVCLYDGRKCAMDFGVGFTPYDLQGAAKQGDVYTLSLDAARGELSYLRNGVSLGVAFSGLPLGVSLYVGVSAGPMPGTVLEIV